MKNCFGQNIVFEIFNTVNLTPHDINIIGEDNVIKYIIPPSGTIARCKTEREITDYGYIYIPINKPDSDNPRTFIISNHVEVPITQTKFGEVEGLPEKKHKTIYIVSSLVAQACKDRNDVFIPDDIVRNEEGKIIGCRSLGRI